MNCIDPRGCTSPGACLSDKDCAHTTQPCRVYDGKCVSPSRCLDRCARQARRRADAERLYGPLYPFPLRKDTKPRAVWPQGVTA